MPDAPETRGAAPEAEESPPGVATTNTLMVLVPGRHERRDRWPLLEEYLLRERPLRGARVLHAATDHLLAQRGAMELADDLNRQIELEWRLAQGYDDILLVGEREGGLILRQAYLLAAGARPGGAAPSPWSSRVSRMILLGTPNRGIDTGWLEPLSWIGHRLPGGPALLQDLSRGSDFVTQLNLAWAERFDDLSFRAPTVVQVRGEKDREVRRVDSIDIESSPHGYHLTVPGARHEDLFDLRDHGEGQARYAHLRDALLSDEPPRDPPRAGAVKNPVIFVLPGVRRGARRLTRTVQAMVADANLEAEVVAPLEGLSLWSLLWPSRRRDLRAFQDAYSYARARHPGAEFACIAHGAGTWILARSLEEVPAMRFQGIFLSGSLIPREYDWARRFELGQTDAIQNVRSAHDARVAIACSALRGIGARHVGTSGFHGFRWRDERLIERAFLPGDHLHALSEGELEKAVAFVLADGGGEASDDLLREYEIAPWFRNLSRAAPYVAMPLLVVAAVGLFVMGRRFGWPVPAVAVGLMWIGLRRV